MRRPLGLFLVALAACGPHREEPPAGRSRWMAAPVGPRPETPDEELGERLYGWNCLPCHGPGGNGDGPMAKRIGLYPRDFTRGAFRLKTSGPDEMPFDDDLYRTIAVGVPISGMPAFPIFSESEVWALVAYVKTLAVGGLFEAHPARTRVAAPAGRGDAVRGGELYRSKAGCGACHGPEGRGDGPSAAALVDGQGRPILLPDFSRGDVTFKAGSRPEDVYRVLTAGMPGSAMPSFAALAERDRADLAAFVATLYRPVHPGERLFLETGCVSCHTIGRGRLIGPDLAGVGARRPRPWLRAWLVEPERLVATDPEARKLLDQYGSLMPVFPLKDPEIDAILDFLSGP
jgi:cytochrome c oxidase cbb3-type subunit 2